MTRETAIELAGKFLPKKERHFAIVVHAKRYNLNSMVLAGKGVDRYIDYLEYKDGTPLTFEEIEELKHNSELHSYLIG